MTYITLPTQLRSNRAVWFSAAVLLSVLAWLGHRLVFSQFQQYDDEGYLLITVQQFLRGRPVYDQTYTQYGPAYYLWQQLLHSVLGIPVTHDATRIVTVVVWLMCAVLIGAIVRLLTKRLLLAAVGTAAAFLHLTQLTFEPGHPQELCLLGVLGAIALTTWRLVAKAHIGVPASIGIWFLVAVTALTKINVGAFLAAALTLGLATSLRRSPWRAAVERGVLAATMAVVPLLMRGDLLRSDIGAYVVVVWCALLSVVVCRSDDAAEDGVVTERDLATGLFAFAIGCVAIVAAIVFEGTSPRALFEGLFVAPLLLPKVFWAPLPVPLLVAAVAPIMLFFAWYWRSRTIAQQRWFDVVALASGVIIFVLSITKTYRVLFAMGPLLAWLVLSDRTAGAEQRAARRILACAAILMGLQAYPMPDGTQIVLGTVLLVPLALVMIAGVQQTLGVRESAPKTPSSLGRRALLAGIAVAGAVNIGIQVQNLYARGVPLALPGARSVRTTARNAATYWWLSTNLRENCDAFISVPGLNSLHFWTGIAPVSSLNATLWPLLFDSDQQRRILAAAMPVERLCVAWDTKQMAVLTASPDVMSRPLMAWLRREFEPHGRVGDWEFRTRQGKTPTVVYGGRGLNDGSIALDLPSMGHDKVARVAIVDVESDHTLSDSGRGDDVVVLGEDGVRMRDGEGIDVVRARRIVVRSVTKTAPSLNLQSRAVRLWAADGRALAIVPVVDDATLDRVTAEGRSRQ